MEYKPGLPKRELPYLNKLLPGNKTLEWLRFFSKDLNRMLNHELAGTTYADRADGLLAIVATGARKIPSIIRRRDSFRQRHLDARRGAAHRVHLVQS